MEFLFSFNEHAKIQKSNMLRISDYILLHNNPSYQLFGYVLTSENVYEIHYFNERMYHCGKFIIDSLSLID